MKIAIIGAKGMLGQELHRTLGQAHDILAWDLAEIDITQRAQTIERLREAKPDLILNSAAFVDVERCESEPDTAWRINAVGAQNLALAAQATGSALLYISTDYVFDGNTNSDYDEVSPPSPINQYGRSKLAGERLSLQICPRTYALRTAWLFGPAPNNYVARVLNAANTDGVVRMPIDQIESPTYTGDLGQAILHLIGTGAYGLYNVTSRGGCTRAEFAQFVLQAAGRSEPVEFVETPPKRLARRPGRTVLDCRLFQLVTGHTLPRWQAGVEAYLAQAAI
jgi:dTDP-4-dehydrorhamnose reductase